MKKDRRTKVLEDTKHCWAHNDKISDKKQRNWEEIYGYKLDEWLDVSVWDGDTVMGAEVAQTYILLLNFIGLFTHFTIFYCFYTF